MLKTSNLVLAFRGGIVASVLALSLAASGSITAQCTGLGAPTNTDTRCVTAIAIGPNRLTSFDISWVDPERGLYFLADRSNRGVDIISTVNNTLIVRAGDATGSGKFQGVVFFTGTTTVNNNKSGPDGVVSHGKWLYAGDGDSTLKVFDISDPTNPKFTVSINTGGATRLDEMALSADGELLLAVNNAEDPPFMTLFKANGDDATDSTSIIKGHITVDSAIPEGLGLSIEQPAWDEEHKKHRDDNAARGDEHRGLFYVSIPTIANNPAGCNDDSKKGAITCSGGLIVLDPSDPNDLTVQPLNECGPNGLTVGPNDNLLEGCTPGNEPSNTSELVINADSFHYANIGGITGSDEVWFDRGDKRYYTGSSRQIGGPVLGVVDATTNLLVETIPQSGGSHSVAADSKRNFIYVPQTVSLPPLNISAGICGTANGCVAVYTDTRLRTDEPDERSPSGDR